jgi:phosphatidate cytidylyltransferase
MLLTRVVVGAVLAALILGVLFVDDQFAPWYPFLLGVGVLLGLAGSIELLGLIPPDRRPASWICLIGVLAIVLVNWSRPINSSQPTFFPWRDPWPLIMVVLTMITLVAFLREMRVYEQPGQAVTRVAYSVFAVVYLALLASFMFQLRWLPSASGDSKLATHALMLTIFVPKCGDIGAYCSGRLFGRHRMTPLLSPKKTWEGAAGGLVFAILTSVAGSSLGARPQHWAIKATAFAVVVGIAGMFGDLAESLIKREGQKKDASQSVPGFGGVLDVIDSILFAAPISYLLLTSEMLSPL